MGLNTWTKLASGLIVPPVRYLHHPCCKKPKPPTQCGCVRSAPDQVQIVLGSITGPAEPWNCDLFNGTFVLNPYVGCNWRYVYPGMSPAYHLLASIAPTDVIGEPGLTFHLILGQVYIEQPYVGMVMRFEQRLGDAPGDCRVAGVNLTQVFKNENWPCDGGTAIWTSLYN